MLGLQQGDRPLTPTLFSSCSSRGKNNKQEGRLPGVSIPSATEENRAEVGREYFPVRLQLQIRKESLAKSLRGAEGEGGTNNWADTPQLSRPSSAEVSLGHLPRSRASGRVKEE